MGASLLYQMESAMAWNEPGGNSNNQDPWGGRRGGGGGGGDKKGPPDLDEAFRKLQDSPVSYTHLTLPTTPYV